MSRIELCKIEEVFKNRIPGDMGRYKHFSILVPLIEKEGELFLLYEVRSEDLKRQPGEICFPGGEMEQGETEEECAVRETMEELGIAKSDIYTISEIDSLHTHSNFTMHCFLGKIENDVYENARPNADEVKETFLVPLSWLLENEPLIYNMEVVPNVGDDFPYELIKFKDGYNWRKGKSQVKIYQYKDRVIWGLTAGITHHFTTVLKEGASI